MGLPMHPLWSRMAAEGRGGTQDVPALQVSLLGQTASEAKEVDVAGDRNADVRGPRGNVPVKQVDPLGPDLSLLSGPNYTPVITDMLLNRTRPGSVKENRQKSRRSVLVQAAA